MAKWPLYLLLFLGQSPWVLAAPGWVSRFEKKAEKSSLKSGLHLKVEDLSQSEALVSLGAEDKVVPASLSKVVTALAAFEEFSPTHRFKTRLLSTARVDGDRLQGDLFLEGGGDPGFISESMWFLVNEFIRTGVKKIEGDLVVDDSRFDGERFTGGRSSQRSERAYDAPVGAMSFNWNSVNIYVRPGSKAGDLAKVVADPENNYIKLDAQVKTTSGSKASFTVERLKGDAMKVRGSIGVDSPEVVKYASITQPDLWSGHSLKSFLAQRGVTVRGQVKTGRADAGAKVLAEGEGKPLVALVTDMMKFSNNFVAEMLTKQLGFKEGAGSATMSSGLEVIRKRMQLWGLKDFSFVNSSGLTQENRLSASDFNLILRRVAKQARFRPEFMASLPISGLDGTLEKRLLSDRAKGAIRAKTGLLNNVSGLAGFASAGEDSLYVFSFIYNGPDAFKARDLFDELASLMVSQ